MTEEIVEKFKLLNLIKGEAEAAIKRNKRRELMRHARDLMTNLDEIYELKNSAREEKLKEEDVATVAKWSSELESELQEFEDLVESLTENIDGIDRSKMGKFPAASDEKVADGNVDFGKKNSAKLPTLEIKKFNGTFVDFRRFWSMFEVEIDNAAIPAVTKLNYLKELCVPKVRLLIEGLPYSVEGYERAKNVLNSTYGKTSEIVNAHIANIMNLPRITGSSPRKVWEFYETLITNIQPLETMGKLKEINGYVRMTLDKLSGIRSDLIRLDDDWQEWEFPRLVEAIRSWTVRNPLWAEEKRSSENPPLPPTRRDKTFTTGLKNSICIFCEKDDHKSVGCNEVSSISERRKVIFAKRLCYNCLKPDHRVAECKSRNCSVCQKRHHTSLCELKTKGDRKDQLLCSKEAAVVYPVVMVEVNGVKCRALLDTGAGSCYVSETLVDMLKIRPVRTDKREIEMMVKTVTRSVKVF